MKIFKALMTGVLSVALLSAPVSEFSLDTGVQKVEASTQVKAMYAKKQVSAYKSRSSKSGRIMTIPYGVRVDRLSIQSSWSQVRYKGKIGWVASRDLVEIKKTEVLDTKKTLTMYASRSTKAKAVTKVPANKQVTRLAVNKSWSQVKYGSKTGWVASSQLKTRYVKENFAPRSYQLKEEAPLQSTYTTSGTTLTSIPKETIVASAERYNSWYKVTFNKKTGWVNGKYLTAYKAPTDAVSVAKQVFGSGYTISGSGYDVTVYNDDVYGGTGSKLLSIKYGSQSDYGKFAQLVTSLHGGDAAELANYMWNARPGQKHWRGVQYDKYFIGADPSGGVMVTW
ncbi:SH3 domain-containing protein [Exiguobacterium profundum]